MLLASHKQSNIVPISVWDTGSGKLLPVVLTKHIFGKMFDVRDGMVLTANATELLSDLHTGARIPSPLDRKLGIFAEQRFGPDPDTILVFGGPSVTRLLNWRTGAPVCRDMNHGFVGFHDVLSVPGTPWIAVCGSGGVKIYDKHSGALVTPPVLIPHSGKNFHRASISANGKTLALSGGSPHIRVVDLSSLHDDVTGIGNPDAELEALKSGSRLTTGGLTRIPEAEWMQLWGDYVAKHGLPPLER